MSDRQQSATVDLKVRMKEPLRAAIEKAARINGVSMNAEAVKRLERSFEREDLTYRIGQLELHAGQVLVVKLSETLANDATGHVQRMTKKVLDAAGVVDVPIMVLDGRADLMVVDGSGWKPANEPKPKSTPRTNLDYKDCQRRILAERMGYGN